MMILYSKSFGAGNTSPGLIWKNVKRDARFPYKRYFTFSRKR